MNFVPTRDAALERLERFLPHAGEAYAHTRNHDNGGYDGSARTNVSQLSPWLHAGLMSESEVIAATMSQHSLQSGRHVHC